jgi:NAD dependent epimerase/dehydratase
MTINMNIKGKKVLITGADGFIGSHLVEKLLAEGASIRALVMYNSFGSWGWLDTISKDSVSKIEIVTGDIRDQNFIRVALEGCEMVFHLAALIAIPHSYNSPESYLDTNIRGTLNILQAAKSLGTKRILLTSTSEVYGTAQYVPIDESHPLQAQSPYSATKIAADKLGESFYKSFGTPVTIVRPFNTYGPRQSGRAIIPTIITQLLSGDTNIKVGSIAPTRDFNYVEDVVEAFYKISVSDKLIGSVVNIATGVEISIEGLLQLLIDKINPNAKILIDDIRLRPEASEVDRLLGNSSFLRNSTDWKPINSLETGLEKTIRWFSIKENLDKYKANIYNI